jgi:hypothetical protein
MVKLEIADRAGGIVQRPPVAAAIFAARGIGSLFGRINSLIGRINSLFTRVGN